ncbi:histidine kinase N-terminal 7TM domain-containing protein [Xinfangfangia sp. CPCC 101601]|uniref:histidine kinase n=1 Tax=Pseudogemmobacter lacusdianii TaxID=3069608 RepID=A0ABU0VVW2_9RHOB|nr:histidine kinase N-terminal 7TM domain-containing protein [Xinfangfangia sp. CPCC 101601]MDQ2065085.1 histidine kinase N-terminal 7TM domain-containing protein [Xinfangfangia sp. CPCC 101601]
MLNCFEMSPIDGLAGVTLFFWLGIAFLLYWTAKSYFFGRTYFLISLLAMLYWLIAVLMELSASELECKVFWAKFAWPAIVLLPTAWAYFLADYARGTTTTGKKLRLVPLIGGPLLAAIMVSTNDLHQLFYAPGTGLFVTDGRLMANFEHGPLFYLVSAMIYISLVTAIGVTVRGILLSSPQHRTFFFGLLLVTLVPGFANLLYIFFGMTLQGFDPTPFAFSATLIILSLMILQNRLLDVTAIAKDLLFYNSADPVVVLDLYGKQVAWNPAARALFLGRDHAKDTHELQDYVTDVVATGGRPETHTLAIGNRFYDPDLLVLKQPFGTERPEIGWLVRLQDSTERRFLSAALQTERDFLALLMETSLSGIIALDMRGIIMFMNSEAGRILGIEGLLLREVTLGDPAWEFQTPEGAPAAGLGHAFARLLVDQKPIRNRRLSLLRRGDGERRMISVNANLLNTPGSDERVVISLADVTEQHQNELRLHALVAKSESESKSKTQFIANMSHEIRTPLNGVLGMAEVLDRLVHDAEQKKMLSTIRHSGELLLSILNDVLDMSKIEAGKLELEATLFRPSQIAARVQELYSVSAEEKGLELEILTSGRPDNARVGDPHRLMQILQNLISNAIKFTAEGEISVIFSCPPGKPLVIEVRDTGIGMTEEQLGRIFNAFEQADGSVTRRFGGTGLGMSIVAKLVSIMNGRIEVESEPDVGTAIRIHLPLEEA